MSIFGPSHKETWTKLSEEAKAEFVNGNIWNSHKVVKQEKAWTITLDTFAAHAGKATIPFTRFRAPFVSKDNFRFKIENRNFFSAIPDFFGRKNPNTGFPDFEKHFVISTKDEYKLQKLLANKTIRELLMGQEDMEFEIKDDEGWLVSPKFPSDVDEVYFQIAGVVKDVERLKLVFTLIAEVLNQLVEINSAYDRNPNITLK